MASLYPPCNPFASDHLKVSDLHSIYYEQCGNPQGEPIVFLHGGPGGGIHPDVRRFFNPKKWHVILFDQRGCGKSTPFAELKENTTWDLIEDIDKIKNRLKIHKWSIFGGSWGSTLALAYAQSYPESCTALYLRGIFMLRQKELQWFYQEGASRIYPDAWEHYLAPIPKDEQDDLIQAYYKRLTLPPGGDRLAAAKAWSTWEAATSKLIQNKNLMEEFSGEEFATAFARIECHYFTNKGFFKEENQLLNNMDKIKHLPAIIIQGRYDMVCTMESAWELHKAWPSARFEIIQDAGHSVSEKGIEQALLKALDSPVEYLKS